MTVQLVKLKKADFEFPVELHDRFREYPPAPQTIAPDIEWFSEFQRELAEKHGIVKKRCVSKST